MVDLTAFEHKGFETKIFSLFQSQRELAEFYEPIADAKSDSPTEALYNAIMKVIDKEA